MFKLVKEKLEPYMINEKLQQCKHEYNTQCNEAVHSAINTVAPKKTDFSRTNSLGGRVAIVVETHTHGSVKFYVDITKNLYCLPYPTKMYLEQRDKKRSYKQEYDQKLNVKRRRREETREKSKTALKQRRVDRRRGTTYESGVAILQQQQEQGIEKYFSTGSAPPKNSRSNSESDSQNNIAKISNFGIFSKSSTTVGE